MAQQKVFSDCPLHRLHIWSQLHISWAHYNRRKFATVASAFCVGGIVGFRQGQKIRDIWTT